MHTIEVAQTKSKTEIASSFEEFTTDQFLYVLSQLLLLENGEISMDAFYTHILLHLMGIEYTPKIYEQEKRMRPEELESKYCNIYQLHELLDFIFIDELNKKLKKKVKMFAYRSVKNIFPEIGPEHKKLYGPKDAITDISFGEYLFACENFEKYSAKKDILFLNMLVACLYRPERENYEVAKTSISFDGHRREEFNKHLAEQRADSLNDMPLVNKYAIYLWFANCLKFVHEGTITVEGNTVDLSKIYGKGGKKDDLGRAGTLYRIAEEGTFGPIDNVYKTGLYDILLKLYQIKTDFEEYKRKNKIKDDSN